MTLSMSTGKYLLHTHSQPVVTLSQICQVKALNKETLLLSRLYVLVNLKTQQASSTSKSDLVILNNFKK